MDTTLDKKDPPHFRYKDRHRSSRSIIADSDGKEKGDGSIPDEDFCKIPANTAGSAENSNSVCVDYYTIVWQKKEELLRVQIGDPDVDVNAVFLLRSFIARC